MSTSLDHLLPGPDERVRCAEHGRAIAIDPGGTAIRADRVVLVATPLPWPKPALAHPLLTDLAQRLGRSPVPTRLLASVPRAGFSSSADGIDVVVYDRDGGSARQRRFRAVDAADLCEMAATFDDDPLSGEAARPAVLICTQGTHDVCCGSEGARLAIEMEKTLPLGVELFRVSHTGGHRFAPTAMTLPDGRMWADLDARTVARLLAGAGNATAVAAEFAPQCRGWWGADTGWAQVAERAVFNQVGCSLNTTDRQVTVIQHDDSTATALVQTPTTTWQVDLAAGREVPTIACREPGGLPAKPAQEYKVLSLATL